MRRTCDICDLLIEGVNATRAGFLYDRYDPFLIGWDKAIAVPSIERKEPRLPNPPELLSVPRNSENLERRPLGYRGGTASQGWLQSNRREKSSR